MVGHEDAYHTVWYPDIDHDPDYDCDFKGCDLLCQPKLRMTAFYYQTISILLTLVAKNGKSDPDFSNKHLSSICSEPHDQLQAYSDCFRHLELYWRRAHNEE